MSSQHRALRSRGPTSAAPTPVRACVRARAGLPGSQTAHDASLHAIQHHAHAHSLSARLSVCLFPAGHRAGEARAHEPRCYGLR